MDKARLQSSRQHCFWREAGLTAAYLVLTFAACLHQSGRFSAWPAASVMTLLAIVLAVVLAVGALTACAPRTPAPE